MKRTRMSLWKSVGVETTDRALVSASRTSGLFSGSDVMSAEASNYLKIILMFGNELKGRKLENSE